MKREEIEMTLGPVDEALAAELIATGATADELREAWGWLNNDEALMGSGRPLPSLRIGELIDILESNDE
ncbi:hypothetical protein V6767_05060 [Martelella sp. FLE1502]|tara:strand:+ start:612 stop:818 length:207 start_codon:yes stop_codon:yes gene_type:complete